MEEYRNNAASNGKNVENQMQMATYIHIYIYTYLRACAAAADPGMRGPGRRPI